MMRPVFRFVVENSVSRRFVRFAMLIATAWMLASCGGGGSSTGGGIMITPPPTQTQSVPDLQMSVGEGQFGSVAPGSTFEVAVVVENAGSVPAASTNIRWLRSDSSTIAATDNRQGSTPVNRLNGGQYVSETFTFTAPTENGVYYYGACVDGVAGETNTRNNCDSSVIRINVGTLQVSVGEGRLDNVASGSTFTVSAVVQFIGSGQSSPARLKWYRSSDAVIQSTDTEMGDDPIPALHRGNSHRESFQFTAPSASGTYYFGACIDQASRTNVRASSCASETVRVTVTPTSDLTVAVGVPENPYDNVQPRSTFRISAVVQNIGAGQSSSTTLRWLRSDSAPIRRTDNVLSTSSVRSLERGGYQRISQTITVPGAEGTYYFGACVDPPDNETDSTNNCSTDVVTIVVRNRPADAPELTIRIGTGRLSGVRSLSSITLNAVVQNVGTGRSEATNIQWRRRSSDSSAETSVSTSSIGALASGEYEEITKTVEAPFLDGTYFYRACIDARRCTESVRVTVE